MRKQMFGALVGASIAAMASPALAHVTLERAEAPAGSTYKAVLRIGHGCDGKATRTLRVQIPDGFYNAKPMPKPGWQLATTTGPYARPYDNHGTAMTEGVREITWSGGELPDDWYDEFVLRGTIGPEVAPGATLYFPTVQECDGAAAEWTDASGNAAAENPAPALQVTEAADHGDGHAHGHGHDAAGAAVLGDLSIAGAAARATPPGAPVGGVVLDVTNKGAADDRLVSASTPVAGRVEIHEMAMEGDIMRMRPLPDGWPVPAGQTVSMQAGGQHLMLMELKGPLVEGQALPLTLRFEHAGEVALTVPVGPAGGKGASHAGH